MRIGWIADPPVLPFGGAQMSSSELVQCAPEWADVLECSPGDVPAGMDLYIILNCLDYDASLIPILQTGKVVKSVRDQWGEGDEELRDWLLDNADVVLFNSQPHEKWFMNEVNVPTAIVPPPMDLQRFRDAAANAGEREGTFWLGAMHRHKGIFESVCWARDHKAEVHFYGAGPYVPSLEEYIRYMGTVSYADVPRMMSKYKTFLYTPRVMDGFARTVAEAWAAGCELELRGIVGAQWWIENNPGALDRGGEMFWDVVKEYANG